MNASGSEQGPVFVDDTGHRRRIVTAIGSMVAIVAIAVAATLGWAVFADAPVSVASGSQAAPHDLSGIVGRAVGVPSGRASDTTGPFAVSTADTVTTSSPPTPCVRVSGTVFNDLDLNGSRQSATEQPVGGVVVELTDTEGHVSATLTDSRGRYSLTVETPGPSRLEFRGRLDEFVATPVGADVAPWVSFPTGGPACEVDTSVMWTGWFEDAATPSTDVTREIGDRVWLDVDGDGVQDPDEPGIADVDLALLDQSGRRVALTTTSDDGTYRFSALDSAATYRIVLAGTVPYTSGPLAGLEPTRPWNGTVFDGTSVISVPGATGRDSGHRIDERGNVFLPVEPDEPGGSEHTYDLGFRPAD